MGLGGRRVPGVAPLRPGALAVEDGVLPVVDADGEVVFDDEGDVRLTAEGWPSP